MYRAEDFAELGITATFAEDFVSRSKKGVVRGFHFSAPACRTNSATGYLRRNFDVAADCDPLSATYGQHVSVRLKEMSRLCFYRESTRTVFAR